MDAKLNEKARHKTLQCRKSALVPLRERGVRILNCLDDWLILCSLAGSCVHRGTLCSSTSACWAFGSTGERAKSCQHRGSLFSAWSWIRSTKQPALPRSVLSQCWTASRIYRGGWRSHWNSFRGSWGIWLQLQQQFRSSAPYETASALAQWRIPRWVWKRGTYWVQITPACRKTFSPWSDPSFLR